MKYTILLCAFILALVGGVCIFCTRTIFKKLDKDINHKVKIVKIIGWILLICGLSLIYFVNK